MKSRSNLNITLGYGTYKITDISVNKMAQLLEAAYNSGYDYIDTAEYYDNETIIGAALQILKQQFGSNFHFPIQTKVWPSHYHNVRAVVLQSLANLQVPFLDSVLLHRPSFDLALDIFAWQQLIQLQQEGLIKTIGVSNYDPEMIEYLHKFSNVYPAINQVQCNIHYPRFDRIKIHQHKNIITQAWRPLTYDVQALQNDPIVLKLANHYQTTPTAIALAYLKYHNIHPVVKSVNVDRIQANATDFFNLNLNADDVAQLHHVYHANNFLASSLNNTYAMGDDELNQALKNKLTKLQHNVEK